MAAKQDYYELLGVERDAGEDQIKQAFRRLARQYHPDANQGDPQAEERFKEINEAYGVLGDAEQRARYDRFGHAGVGNGSPGGPGPNFGGFEDILDMFFGGMGGQGRRQAPGPERGGDLQLSITIDLGEAARGLEREVEVSRIETCAICGGNGVRPGTRPERCGQCSGTGQVSVAQSTVFGRILTTRSCEVCGGRGYVTSDPCPECDGRGLVRRNRKVVVRVPAGVDDQSRLRLSGQGQAGLRGGGPGDLYVEVRVKPHPRLERRGNDVLSRERVSYSRASLGGPLSVETLWGAEEIELPPGTQPGDIFALRGKGLPDLRGRGRGDHQVVVQLEVPKRVSQRQRQLLVDLALESGEDLAAAPGQPDKPAGGKPAAAKIRPARSKRKRGLLTRVRDAFLGDEDEPQ